MDEYSIEQRSQRIYDKRTRDYFSEVSSSYRDGNNRSSVVMLWSVVVCDILFKLQHLVDMYSDSISSKILAEISKLQEENERSSDWEIHLIKLVYERTMLIDIGEYENLQHLQRQRHLSAHPIVNGDMTLHQPNKDTVRALIRNTLDGVLTKPPIFTRKIFEEFITDLANSSEILIEEEKLKKYLESKYFSNLTPNVETIIFKSLWKLIFRIENEDCTKNRSINYKALKIIYRRNHLTINQQIADERDYFSNISSDNDVLYFLVHFLSRNAFLYEALTDAAKIKIEHCVGNHKIGKILGWFIKPSFNRHYDDLLSWIEGDEYPDFTDDTFIQLRKCSDTPGWEESVNKLASAYYSISRSFNTADKRFSQAIRPLIGNFQDESLIFLLQKIENNNQTYGRGGSAADHKLIYDRIVEKLGKEFDYSPFPHFFAPFERDS